MFQFNFILKICILIQVAKITEADHVASVRCAEDRHCLQHINEEIVDVILGNLRMANESEPCENFWDYACGEWTAAPYYDHVDNFGAIDNYYAQQLQKYLQKTTPNSVEVAVADIEDLLAKLRIYYKACRDIKSYYLPMHRYFEKWPDMGKVLTEPAWNGTNFNWLTVIAELRQYGLNGVFLDEAMGMAYNDSTKYVIELKMPEETDNFENKYKFVNYFVEFGWIERATEEHLHLAGEIFEFEKQLKTLRAKHRHRKENDLSLTLKQLKQKVKAIDWQIYFNVLLGQEVSDLPIEVANLPYMAEVADLLEHTDDKIICLYIVMRLCKYLLDVGPRITDKNCIDHMGVTFPLGMNYIYNRFVYRTRQADEKVLLDMLSKLKMQFSNYLQKNKLNLNVEEMQYLQLKLNKMILRVGNLPPKKHSHFYNSYYDSVHITETNFFHNHWEMLRFRTQKQHSPLLADAYPTLNLDDFYVNDDILQIRNAPYFVHQRNLLIVPMIFVQMPFFHHKLDSLFQYSLVGWILAHELNHAFETFGLILDADGNESVIGAAIKSNPSFIKAVKCLERRPSAAIIERIADVNGFQLAYDAFFDSSHSRPQFLPFSRDFTLQQLYFLNFAQFFCGNLPRPIDHDRDDLRVIEVVANMPEFAEAFKCAADKRENPIEKCKMWRL